MTFNQRSIHHYSYAKARYKKFYYHSSLIKLKKNQDVCNLLISKVILTEESHKEVQFQIRAYKSFIIILHL
jgi:hypothetical protein